MRINVTLMLGVLIVGCTGLLFMIGCCRKPVAGPVEKAGAALDKAVQDSETAAKAAASKAVEKSGLALEKAGAAVQRTGEELRAKEGPAKTP